MRKIGRYEVIRELGEGGMAMVVYARDPRFKREVAIKVLPAKARSDARLKKRFEREAQTIASFEHPAIVPVYDTGNYHGRPYLVMRYMAGGSLAARLQQGPLSVVEAVNVMFRIAAALDFAHGQGVIHRDLKPANVLFDRFGEAYLSDFGIVMLEEATQSLTKTGAILGTPAYMSPEQVQGDEGVDAASDIYSLGIILFEMLTGEQPYSADTPTRLMMRHVLDPIPSLRDFNPELPEGAQQVISRAMAKNKRDRYSSAGQLAQAARVLLGAERRGAATPTPPLPRPRPKINLRFPRTLVPEALSAAPLKTLAELAELPEGGRRALRFLPLGLVLAALIVLSGGSSGAALPPNARQATADSMTAAALAQPSVTPTRTPSPTPSPTATASATASPSPTATATPTATPDYIWLVVSDGARCRTGPSRGFPTFGFLVAGDLVQAFARNPEGTWWWIAMPDGSGRCWVSNNLVSQPVSPFEPPDTPIPTPSATSTISG